MKRINYYSKAWFELKTKEYYKRTYKNKENYKEIFKDVYDIDYELVYQDKPFEESLFELLYRHYRNKELIKNVFYYDILKKLKDITVISEYPLYDSYCDIAIASSYTRIAFIIKSKHDSLFHINKQLNFYAKFFDYIYLVIENSKLDKALKEIPLNVGIYSFPNSKKKLTFTKIRNAKPLNQLSIVAILNHINNSFLMSYYGLTARKALAFKSLDEIDLLYTKFLYHNYKKKPFIPLVKVISIEQD